MTHRKIFGESTVHFEVLTVTPKNKKKFWSGKARTYRPRTENSKKFLEAKIGKFFKIFEAQLRWFVKQVGKVTMAKTNALRNNFSKYLVNICMWADFSIIFSE